jgi:hypothetical protein
MQSLLYRPRYLLITSENSILPLLTPLTHYDNTSVMATVRSRPSVDPAVMWDEIAPFFFLLEEELVEGLLLLVAVAWLLLTGNTPTCCVGCVPNCPFPTITHCPMLGMPLTVTKTNAGPGWNKLGLGGNWDVCKMIVPLG